MSVLLMTGLLACGGDERTPKKTLNHIPGTTHRIAEPESVENLDLELKTHMSSVPGEFVERIRSIITGVDPTPEAPIETPTENTAEGDVEHPAAENTDAATSEGEDASRCSVPEHAHVTKFNGRQ